MQDRRHFEDLSEGEAVVLATAKISKEMIFEFARQFDPLPFHLDEAAAKKSLLGGLAASGWQTAAISLRLFVDGFLGELASLGGLGFSNLKWLRPVMAGDTIGGRVTISNLKPSRTRRGWGIVTFDFDIRNQNNQPVMTMCLTNLVARRPAPALQDPTPQDPT
ncbi:MAG: MaoC family dehydratase [Alphaproteobacteria bacterium]|nr:MaoC family dehydratase [Alphaproteobacteria bacterium]